MTETHSLGLGWNDFIGPPWVLAGSMVIENGTNCATNVLIPVGS